MMKELFYQIDFLESDPYFPMDTICVRIEEGLADSFTRDLKSAIERKYGDEVEDRIEWVNDEINLAASKYGALWSFVPVIERFLVQ